jgi:PAS domain S-box-containing protein
MKMKWQFIGKMPVAFGAALALLLVVGVVSYRINRNQVENEKWVAHTHEVLAAIEAVLSNDSEAESAQRGYFITGEGSFWEEYHKIISTLQANLARVRALTADNPAQQRRLDVLDPLIARRLALLEQLLGLQKDHPADTAGQKAMVMEGHRTQLAIHRGLDEMAEAEHTLLQLRIVTVKASTHNAIITILLGTCFALGLLCAVLYLLQREITQRAGAEEARREAEERFRTLANNISQLAWIADEKGYIFWYNQRWFDYTGTTLEEMAGWGWQTVHHPDHVQQVVARISKCFQSGEVWEDTFPLRGRDGNYRWFLSRAVPIRDPEGKVLRWFGTNTDITERKKDEEALRGSEEKLRMAVEAGEMGTWFWNIQQDEISWSAKFRTLFGLTSDAKLTYQTALDLIHPDDRQRIDQSVKDTLERGVPYDIEYRVVWPDSSVHWIAAKGRAHRSPEGVAVHMQGIVMDVTESKVAQEAQKHDEARERRSVELKRSNDELQQFAYIAAHDLQEPLRMVASYTQLLAKRYKGRLDSDADEFIAYAVDGAHRMQLLIGDLLAYCRVGTKGKELRETSSEAALEQALLNLQGAIQEGGGVVTHDPLPTVLADGAQLVQLFQNVVGNAIKYHGAELPRVHVSAKKNGGKEWIFSMRDNGLGIDPKYFEKIFVMFQRLHGREEFSGTGIGLTVCKKIAERHGGRMWVESEPGKGSTFYLALPERG